MSRRFLRLIWVVVGDLFMLGWTTLGLQTEGIIMADESRRPGDWQRKDLRQNANDLIDDNPNPKKWHKQTFWIVFFTLILWPVGLVLVWRSDWHIVAKILVTVFVVFTVYFAWNAWQAVQQIQMAG